MRLYLTPSELQEMPLGVGLQSQLAGLSSGVVDKLLARASARCDAFCRRRLQAPGSTTLAADAASGATTLSLTSTLTLDNLDEQAVILGSGATQETISLVAGGVTVSSWTSPYPGTVKLETPLLYSHNSGEPVQLVYREVTDITEAGHDAQGGLYAGITQSNTVKLSMTYLPPLGDLLSRTVFLKTYPILEIDQVEYAYFSTGFTGVDFTEGLSIVPNEGWYQFRVGQIILRDGLLRTTYRAGYEQIPDDIKEACSYFLAEQLLQQTNPYGLVQTTMGKRTLRWSEKALKLATTTQAEDILSRYVRRL